MIKYGTLVRIEGKYAVLRWNNGSSFIPRRFLPSEARVGDTIIRDNHHYYLEEDMTPNFDVLIKQHYNN